MLKEESLVGVSRETLEEARRNWKVINSTIPGIIKKRELTMISEEEMINEIKSCLT